MIASLRGILTHATPDELIVEVGGVGYQVRCMTSIEPYLPKVGDEVFLFIHTNVRDDAIDLYGFLDAKEKEMFLLLVTVSGIGPRLAMTILGGMGPADLAHAIGGGDIARLTRLQGVGKKTAERLCVELKDKVKFLPISDSVVLPYSLAEHTDQLSADVVSALVNLGYSPANARKALDQVVRGLGDDEYAALALGDLLRLALRSLA
ncbi:MAG: Holliday junction branch migration protein RuvA [Proteobacteria bacterium]|nr:Holliday junction branch migration protein RuvA [Pseudomonadota bacterium]MBU1686830.1 Holliday junction branch migration protein RuvA [Pseudomonadota bacterium]